MNDVSRPPDPGPLVQVEDLLHRYGEREALGGVSFTVGRGEIFGLLGPNGGGKTTLFKILSTAQIPTAGRATVLGSDLAGEVGEVRAKIGVVFQAPGLDKKLTVGENLLHQGHLYGLRGAPLRTRIADLLARFGLSDRLKERVETLSGGLARRVEIAKGLLHRPELLLLDEPSVGLDPGARRDLWQHLEDLRSRDGGTVLLTTHFLEEAEGCDRVAILDRGRLVALGTPEALKQEIEGESVRVSGRDLDRISRWVQEHWGVTATRVDGGLQVASPDAAGRIGDLMKAFPAEIASVQVRKPTLEDVFMRKTGHRFAEAGAV